MVDNPNIRAVPNPPENEKTEERIELVKTTVITSLVGSFIGVFAMAGGWAVFNLIRGAVLKRRQPERTQPVAAQPAYDPYTYGPPEPQYDSSMPEALRMNVRLRPTRRRKTAGVATPPPPAQHAAPPPPVGTDPEELRAMFAEFQSHLDARLTDRFGQLEKRIDELYEEDEYEDEEDDD